MLYRDAPQRPLSHWYIYILWAATGQDRSLVVHQDIQWLDQIGFCCKQLFDVDLKDMNHLYRLQSRPKRQDSSISIAWLTVWNALVRSIKTAPVTIPPSIAVNTLSMSWAIAVAGGCFQSKTTLLLGQQLRFSLSWLCIAFSRILLSEGKTEIGLWFDWNRF